VYESAVGIWIDRPSYLNYKDSNVSWVSPVQSQSGLLAELLRTRAFLADVANRTSLGPLMATPAGEARVSDIIARSVSIAGGGGPASTFGADHLLTIRVQYSNPQLAFELCKAIVEAYQEKTDADMSDQTDLAIQFYTGRVQESQQQLNKVTQDLRRYAASRQIDPNTQTNPNSPDALPAAMLDPRLASLQSAVQQAQADFSNAQAALTNAQRDAMAAQQGQELGFQVLDEPRLATAPISQLKKIMMYPIAGLVVGLGLSGMLLVLFLASDRTVRVEADVTPIPGLRMLGTVPNLKLKRRRRKQQPVLARRAIGAMAGTALPAPGGTS
jgi:capsular polysaccharide biosynthesis protein